MMASTVPSPTSPLDRDLDAVREAILAVHEGIVLLPPRIVRRVIKRDRDIRMVGLQVPHEDLYVLPAERLRAWVDRRELPRRAPLPPTVILLPEPEPEDLRELGSGGLLTRYWRLVFHALVDAALADTPLDRAAILARIDTVGQTAFDEVRAVLRQEHRVLPPGDDATVWREFVALWLELRHFAPERLARFFPALAEERDRIDTLLAEDLPAPAALLEQARPDGAAPASQLALLTATAPDHAADDEEDSIDLPLAALVSETATALDAGNFVRAAILRVRANPQPTLTATTRGVMAAEPPGQAELVRLAHALSEAQARRGPSAEDWVRVLRPVLDASRRGRLRQEVRLLFDLQRVATDHARPTSTADVMGWLTSLGQRAVRRTQPAREQVNRVRFLRRARDRVRRLRLGEDQVQDLGQVLGAAVATAEQRLRETWEPRLREALAEVGLEPQDVPERVARDKLVTELMEQLVERGFLDQGSLRDAISRNQLKLRDLSGPLEVWRGDPLLQLNRRMASVLDGVYRPGEVYLRGLQRASSLAFATRLGRWLVLFLMLPFGAAFVALEGLQHMVGPVVGLLGGTLPKLVSWWTMVPLGLYLMALLHVPAVRRGSRVAVSTLAQVLRVVFVTLPRRVLGLRAVRWVLDSWPVQALRAFVLRPALVAALFWWVVPAVGAPTGLSVLAAVTLYFAAAVLLNSPLGWMMEEHLTDHAARTWRQLRHRLIPGLLRWIVDFFDQVLDRFERVLYAVDERLRYRRGESSAAFVVKAALGAVWFVLTYLARIYVTLLIEPQVNPIKHFPVVTVSHKIILPFSLTMTAFAAAPLEPLLGVVIANAVAGFTVFLLPGVFGFLVWELKENWRLYEANRPQYLSAVRVGSHGETMLQLMRPGFHSGTLPKLFARMRRAERGRRGLRDARTLRKLRQELHHIEEAVTAFVEREMLSLLAAAHPRALSQLEVTSVTLASNRVRTEIGNRAAPKEGSLRLAFEEQSGWLVAGVYGAGWVAGLEPALARRVEQALAGLYARAGVDLVREQLIAALPEGARYDVSDRGLEVWLGGEPEPWVYDLDERPVMQPHRVGDAPADAAPALEARAVSFGEHRIAWQTWRAVWNGDAELPVQGLIPALRSGSAVC